jgi:hypothetical protein
MPPKRRSSSTTTTTTTTTTNQHRPKLVRYSEEEFSVPDNAPLKTWGPKEYNAGYNLNDIDETAEYEDASSISSSSSDDDSDSKSDSDSDADADDTPIATREKPLRTMSVSELQVEADKVQVEMHARKRDINNQIDQYAARMITLDEKREALLKERTRIKAKRDALIKDRMGFAKK